MSFSRRGFFWLVLGLLVQFSLHPAFGGRVPFSSSKFITITDSHDLDNLRRVGDVNGDGYYDFIVSGGHSAWLVLGSADLFENGDIHLPDCNSNCIEFVGNVGIEYAGGAGDVDKVSIA